MNDTHEVNQRPLGLAVSSIAPFSPFRVRERTYQSWNVVANPSVPDSEDHPFPEDTEIEVVFVVASFIENRVIH